MNWFTIIVAAIALIVLMVFLVRRNMKDEKKFEQDLNNDYPHSTDRPSDIELEDTAN